MKLKKELKKKVENFIESPPSDEEAGGFLFANRKDEISDFLPIQNLSKNPQHEFLTNWKEAGVLAERYYLSKRGERTMERIKGKEQPIWNLRTDQCGPDPKCEDYRSGICLYQELKLVCPNPECKKRKIVGYEDTKNGR